MPKIKFTQEQVLATKAMESGWYPLKITAIDEALANDKESYNWVVEFSVASGPNQGVPIKDWQSEKPMGMAKRISMMSALTKTGKVDANTEYGELDSLVGKELEGYCVYDSDFKSNKVQDFRPKR